MLSRRLKVFLDESGDLGFTHERGSKYFVVAVLATYDSEKLSRLIKRANRNFSKERKGAIEFSFRDESEQTRQFFLTGVAKNDCWIAWIALKKTNCAKRSRNEWYEIYDELCSNVLVQISNMVHSNTYDITVDRFYSKESMRKKFDARVKECISVHRNLPESAIKVHHPYSMNSECLQVQDFVVGAIFQMLERGNEGYYRLIDKKIVSLEYR